MLLHSVPVSIGYTLLLRQVAGPGFTDAPNQSAMIIFFIGALGWVPFSIVLLGGNYIWASDSAKVNVILLILGSLGCIVSWFIPFSFGML